MNANRRPGPRDGRLPGIDGLRAIAAASIVVYHCWLYAAPSAVSFGPFDHLLHQLPLGVTLFFALSGFLLYRPFAAAIMDWRAPPKVSAYFRNRALRILPAYWVILFVSAGILGTALIRTSALTLGTGSFWTRPGLMVRNALFIQNYDPQTFLTGIGPAWSLAIEVVFYCCLPLFAFGAFVVAHRATSHATRTFAAFAPPLAMLVIGWTGKAAATYLLPDTAGGAWVGSWHSVLLRGFLGQADLFAYGMGLAVLYAAVEHGDVRLPSWWRAPTAAALLAISLPAVWLVEHQLLSDNLYGDVMAIAAALLIALVVLPEERGRWWLPRLLETRPIVAVGLVSYSVFLWHEPLVRWLNERGFTLEGRGGFLVNMVVLVTVTGTLSTLTYRFVERPALARKRRQVPTSEPATPVAMAATPGVAHPA